MGPPNGGEWSFLLHNNYQPHYSTLNLLWFHDGSEFPQVVTKLYRQPEVLQREFQNLTQAHACVPALVPKPLHFGQQQEFWTLWMEGVPGWRIHTEDQSPAMLRSMVDMVASMHGALRVREGRVDPDRYRRMVTEPLATLAQFGQAASVQAGCAALAARISADWVQALPIIPQHGDLFLSNVLSSRGQWRVVDWETFGVIDFPFYDVFTLLLSVLRAEGETPEQWQGPLVKQAPALTASYAQALGLSLADVPLFLPLTLANWFHLQWADGRKEFADRMYATIQHYFEHPEAWERSFLAAGSAETPSKEIHRQQN